MPQVNLSPAILLGLLACAAPAVAQSNRNKPVIDETLDASQRPTSVAPQGGVIILKGRNLFKQLEPPKDEEKKKRGRKLFNPFEGLTVTIGGQSAVVFASTFDLVTVQIPMNLAPGKSKRIVLDISGRGSAKSRIDVMTPDKFQKSAAGKREGGEETGSGVVQRAEESVLKSFDIKKFVMKQSAAGFTFLVEGIANKVPDGLTVQIKLMFGTRVIRDRAVLVAGGKFSTTFGPYKERLLVGNYAVELVFALSGQSRTKRRPWVKKLSREERKLFKRIVRRGYTSVGGSGPAGQIKDEDTAKQREEQKQHAKNLATEAEKLLDEVVGAYAVACRCFWKKGASSYDEAAYLTYLKKQGYAADDDAAEKIKKDTRFATRRGHFDNKKWEEWARATLHKGLKELNDKHVAFNKQWIVPPDGRAERLGHFLISNVLRLFQKWSSLLYARSKISMPQDLGSDPFMAISAPRASVKYFKAKRRELMRVVGLPADG